MSGSLGQVVKLQTFRSPGTVIGRFIAKRSLRSTVIWAMVFGAYVASKAIGYATTYPTELTRAKVAATYSTNIGLQTYLGIPHHLETVAGFTVWSALGVITIVGAIWGMLLATRTFRGEEDAGRWELLLTGQTTPRGAAINALAGLGSVLLMLYTVTAITFIGIGKMHTLSFTTSASAFFALSVIAGAAMFMAIGALMSQIMPTRARAAGITAALFGLCFVVRVVGDITPMHWLLSITPLGWIEKLQPLYDSQPIWLLPIGALITLCCVCTAVLAGRRDLGESIFIDKDVTKPRTLLLGAPLGLALRMTRGSNLGWLAGVALGGLLFGVLVKTAAQAFNDSIGKVQVALDKLAPGAQGSGETIFLGIAFFMMTIVIMAYAASAVSAIREDEAEGYVDNLLVRTVSRWRWLSGRILMAAGVSIVAGLVASIFAWVGETSQHSGVPLSTMLAAGINITAPALLIVGIGIFTFGIWPRLTSVLAYGAIAWSFLIEMVTSGINLNHWIHDTSIMHHMALAPAVSARWGMDLVLIAIGIGLCLIGGTAFNRRDLMSE